VFGLSGKSITQRRTQEPKAEAHLLFILLNSKGQDGIETEWTWFFECGFLCKEKLLPCVREELLCPPRFPTVVSMAALLSTQNQTTSFCRANIILFFFPVKIKGMREKGNQRLSCRKSKKSFVNFPYIHPRVNYQKVQRHSLTESPHLGTLNGILLTNGVCLDLRLYT
jgi:hypothetical protein